MTSIERTAYPRFKRLVTARELHVFFTPREDEAAWARAKTDSDEHLLALVLALKCFQRMGRFPRAGEVPEAVVDFVRRDLGLGEATKPVYASAQTAKAHRDLVRKRVGAVYDPPRAREIAETAIRAEAQVKNNPADLVNVALERLVEASLELPGFTTLDEMTSTIRAEVNGEICRRIHGRMGEEDHARLERLLDTRGPDGRTLFNRLKKPARRATWSHLREQEKHLAWVDSLGDTGAWLAGVAPGKAAAFAGEADAADAGVLRDYGQVKRIALLACMAQRARQQARDDLAAMFCKRVAIKVKAARDQLDEIRRRQQALVDQLVANYKTLLEQVDAGGPAAARQQAAAEMAARAVEALGGPATTGDGDARVGFGRPSEQAGPAAVAALLKALEVQAGGLGLVQAAVEGFGGFAAQYADIEAVAAHHGDNYELLVARHLRKDRAAMFDLAGLLELTPTSADRRVLDALAHARAHRTHTRDFIPDHDENGRPVDVSFASQNWQKALRDRAHPGRFARRHFEACVFTHLAEELQTGDVAVAGSHDYADWAAQLLSWEECQDRLPGYLADVGLCPPPADGQPAPDYTAATFRARLEELLTSTAAGVDAGYPDNDDLVIDEKTKVPVLKRRRRAPRRPSAARLEQLVKQRMPQRSLLAILARTAYWLEWWRHFGPASGSDPKISNPFLRYVLAVFVYGVNMTAADAARHIAGISAHELSMVANRHITIAKLNEAITDVINAFAQLDLVKAWGDGSSVAADGTHMETYLDNLLAETSIRYGAVGGIAYHHVSDHYIALFTHFVSCGVWEAVYIIEGLLANASEVRPSTIHADTQGQSFPVFTLAHLLGFELMPRIRNWKDLVFFRPSAQTRYDHIDGLFGEPGRNAIDWELIETHCSLVKSRVGNGVVGDRAA